MADTSPPRAHLFQPTPEGVSPRPWECGPAWILDADGRQLLEPLGRTAEQAKANAEHIAHMANNWDALRSEHRALIALNEKRLAERAELRASLSEFVAFEGSHDRGEGVDTSAIAGAANRARALLARTGGTE